MADDETPRPLPDRPPRPLAVHWVIDAVVAFLLTAIVALFLGASLTFVIIAAAIAGVFLAPWTRSLEARGLARRRQAREQADDTSGPTSQ